MWLCNKTKTWACAEFIPYWRFLFVVVSGKTGFYYVALAGLELTEISGLCLPAQGPQHCLALNIFVSPSEPSWSFPPQANHSSAERFLLLGFSDWPSLQPVLFALVLLCYLLTLTGNAALVLLAIRDPRLHTPMYYFLCHLALVDVGFTTSVVPPLLASLRG